MLSALLPCLRIQVVAVEVLGLFRDQYLKRIFSSGGIQSDNTFQVVCFIGRSLIFLNDQVIDKNLKCILRK